MTWLHGREIAALVGYAKWSVTSKYVHTLDTALIMATVTIAGLSQVLGCPIVGPPERPGIRPVLGWAEAEEPGLTPELATVPTPTV
jgi:hypothetical protein